jgi:hypothetical protein
VSQKREDFNLEYLPALITATKLFELMREPEEELIEMEEDDERNL